MTYVDKYTFHRRGPDGTLHRVLPGTPMGHDLDRLIRRFVSEFKADIHRMARTMDNRQSKELREFIENLTRGMDNSFQMNLKHLKATQRRLTNRIIDLETDQSIQGSELRTQLQIFKNRLSATENGLKEGLGSYDISLQDIRREISDSSTRNE